MKYALVDTANTFFRARYVASRNADAWQKLGMALHLSLASVNQVVRKHGIDHVVFCLEGRSWRKDFYKPYKANRAVDETAMTDAEIEENKMFWETYELFTTFLREKTNCSVIRHPAAEADDIIAVLAMRQSAQEKVMILSSDKDFAQLQKFSNVEQFSPILKKFIKEPLPAMQLKQMIVRGDKGDGIPNIMSPDNVFTEGGRQKPITEAKIIVWLNQEPKEFCNEDMLRNYKRNELLIDLTQIPESLQQTIVTTYENTTAKSKQVFMNYMIANKLKNLIEVLDEF